MPKTAAAETTPPSNAANTAPNPSAQASSPDADDADFVNLNTRLPMYAGLDARLPANNGKRGPRIKGRFLTTVDLTAFSKQTDEKGNKKPWIGVVVELTADCPVREKKGNDLIDRMAKPGERMMFTVSKAFERFAKIAEHPTHVYECIVQPEISRNAKNQPLTVFPEVKVNPKTPVLRDPTLHLVSVDDIMPQLGTGASGEEPDGAIPALPVS